MSKQVEKNNYQNSIIFDTLQTELHHCRCLNTVLICLLARTNYDVFRVRSSKAVNFQFIFLIKCFVSFYDYTFILIIIFCCSSWAMHFIFCESHLIISFRKMAQSVHFLVACPLSIIPFPQVCAKMSSDQENGLAITRVNLGFSMLVCHQLPFISCYSHRI